MASKVTEKIEIKAIPLSQEVLKNIDMLHYILTKVEFIVLKILERLKYPCTTKQIRNFYIMELSNMLVNFSKKETLEDVLDPTITQITLEKAKEFAKNSEEAAKKYKGGEFIFWSEKELKKLGFKIPSYKTIEKALFGLEMFGITIRRKDTLRRKGKHLWLLNPNFLFALKKKG